MAASLAVSWVTAPYFPPAPEETFEDIAKREAAFASGYFRDLKQRYDSIRCKEDCWDECESMAKIFEAERTQSNLEKLQYISGNAVIDPSAIADEATLNEFWSQTAVEREDAVKVELAKAGIPPEEAERLVNDPASYMHMAEAIGNQRSAKYFPPVLSEREAKLEERLQSFGGASDLAYNVAYRILSGERFKKIEKSIAEKAQMLSRGDKEAELDFSVYQFQFTEVINHETFELSAFEADKVRLALIDSNPHADLIDRARSLLNNAHGMTMHLPGAEKLAELGLSIVD